MKNIYNNIKSLFIRTISRTHFNHLYCSTQQWMVYKGKSQSKTDDDWGYPYFRKLPFSKESIVWYLTLDMATSSLPSQGMKLHLLQTLQPQIQEIRSLWREAGGLGEGWRYGGFQKWEYPYIINFHGIFHYKPSFLGYPYFRKPPYTRNILRLS